MSLLSWLGICWYGSSLQVAPCINLCIFYYLAVGIAPMAGSVDRNVIDAEQMLDAAASEARDNVLQLA